MLGRISIYLGCGRLKDLGLRSFRQTEHVESTENRGLGGLDRVILIKHGRSGTSEVVDLVDLRPIWLSDIMTDELKARMSNKVPDILLGTAVEII